MTLHSKIHHNATIDYKWEDIGLIISVLVNVILEAFPLNKVMVPALDILSDLITLRGTPLDIQGWGHGSLGRAKFCVFLLIS